MNQRKISHVSVVLNHKNVDRSTSNKPSIPIYPVGTLWYTASYRPLIGLMKSVIILPLTIPSCRCFTSTAEIGVAYTFSVGELVNFIY